MKSFTFVVSIILALINIAVSQLPGGQRVKEVYYGTHIGRLNKFMHDVSGEVYAVDESTIFIKNFNYDGQGPHTFFWAGNSPKPDDNGFIIPDEKGSTKTLGAYSNQNIVLRLPEGKTLRDIKWLSVWCREFKVNFGDILIPRSLPIPSPVEIPALSRLAHGVKSSPITIVDAQTFLIPNFHYDGEGPAGYWWLTRGQRQGPRGLRLKDENGSTSPLRRYNGETVVISLPDEMTIYDFDWLGVWCEQFNVDFGSVRIPQHVRVPPSPKMLGIKPETKLNCEVLYDELGFELRWVMDGDDIVMQLVGKVEPNEYMSFGLSKDDSKSEMINSDAVVAWVAPNGNGRAVDYFLGSKEQCVGNRGSCPDVKHRGASDSVTLLHAAIVNGFSMVTFKRPQLGLDEQYDQHIYSDGQQAVMWAIGPLNERQETSYHRLHNNGDMFMDFSRTPKWNCPLPDDSLKQMRPQVSESQNNKPTDRPQLQPIVQPTTPTAPEPPKPTNRQPEPQSTNAWTIPPIACPIDTTFRAQIGPTGGTKGYQSITGKVGWGIAWYINGLLIPEMTLQRGKTYTFIVEGGNDKNNSARRHPLYLTDDPEGGFDYKSDEERQSEQIFGGVGITPDGTILPTAEGRLCEWKIDTSRRDKPENYENYFDFQRSLNLDCQPGNSGILRFSPDQNTPDLIYYQCYTHRNLGWKIHVVDNCDSLTGQSSIPKVSIVKPEVKNNKKDKQQLSDAKPTKEVQIEEKSKPQTNTKFGERGQVFFPDLKRTTNATKVQTDVNRNKQNPKQTEILRTRQTENQKQSSKPSTVNKSTNGRHRQRQQSSHLSSPKPVPQIPAPHYGPHPHPFHGPPPYLFSHQNLPGPQGFLGYPSGPINPMEHVFRPQHIPKPIPQQIPQLDTQSGQESAVQNLHGGFVPMLIKTANQSIVQHFALKAAQTPNATPKPLSSLNVNPFNKNASTPFHPTFKAPNPDYSGFNISRYGEISPKGTINNIKPVQLNKPIVPIPSRPKPERVNNPVRYRIKPNNPINDKELLIPDSIVKQNENIPSKEIFNDFVDINDENDYMIAIERGSQSAESQNNAAFINVQDINKLNTKIKNQIDSKIYGSRIKGASSPSTTDHNVEVVDESPLKQESEVSPKTTIVIPLTKEQMKNKTDHTILTDVLRLIAQNAPAIAPQETHIEVHTIAKRDTHNHKHDGHHNHNHHKNNIMPLIPNIFTSLLVISTIFYAYY